MKSELEARMKKDTGFGTRFFPHYLKARAMRADLRCLAAELRSTERGDEALQRVWPCMPELKIDQREQPRLEAGVPKSEPELPQAPGERSIWGRSQG